MSDEIRIEIDATDGGNDDRLSAVVTIPCGEGSEGLSLEGSERDGLALLGEFAGVLANRLAQAVGIYDWGEAVVQGTPVAVSPEVAFADDPPGLGDAIRVELNELDSRIDWLSRRLDAIAAPDAGFLEIAEQELQRDRITVTTALTQKQGGGGWISKGVLSGRTELPARRLKLALASLLASGRVEVSPDNPQLWRAVEIPF